jgi:predicted exporter
MNDAQAEAVRTRFWIGLALLVVLAGTFALRVAPRLQVQTDLLALLPAEETDTQLDAALDEVTARLARQVLFLVGAPRLEAARPAAEAFAAVLGRSAVFESVHAGAGDELGPMAELYFKHRFFLLSHEQQRRLAAEGAGGLYRDALRVAYTPVGFLRPLSLARDPLGLGADYLSGQMKLQGKARLDGSQLVVSDAAASYVVLAARLRASPFSVEVQRQAQDAIDRAEDAARAAGGARIVWYRSGVLPHAAAATSAARTEVSVFSTLAGAGVLGLMLLLFGSWRAPALGVLALLCGAVAGVTAAHVVFGEVHLIALVFGSSLIGVAVDYCMHFFADQFRAPPSRWPREALAHVGRPILLGLATSLLGYMSLAWLPFPGLQQMAVISMAGLIAACGCVLLLFPVLAPAKARALPQWCNTVLTGIERRMDALWRPRSSAGTTAAQVGGAARVTRVTRTVLAALIVLLLALAFSRLEVRDDLTSLQARFPQLLDQERRVQTLLGTVTESRFFVVMGADAEAVLEAQERLAGELDELIGRGKLETYTAVTRSLPSLARQREIHTLLGEEVYARDGVLAQLMRALGFEAAAVEGELAAFAQASERDMLTPAEWLASSLSAAYRPLWLPDLPGGVASVTTLGGIHDVAALRQAAERLPEVRLIDRVGDIGAVLAHYRTTVLKLLLAAYAAIGMGLTLRYGFKDAVALVAAPLIASIATVSVMAGLGVMVNLFTMLALLLLLALGVDYGIFLHEAHAGRRAALLAISSSALTTALAFGLLAFSSTPPVAAVGKTLVVGIGGCWLAAVIGDAWRRGRAVQQEFSA